MRSAPVSYAGILPAAVTPLNEQDNLDTRSFELLLERFYDAGCHGVYVCGQTGEGLSLPLAVRELAVEVAAANTPAPPPSSDSSKLSVRSWPTIRRRGAPNATRTAISRCLEVARASIEFATVKHTIGNINPTAPENTSRAGADRRSGFLEAAWRGCDQCS